MSNLLKSPGWAHLVERLEGQTKVRMGNVVHTPCKNMEAVFEQEYEKGEIAGMYTAMRLPEVLTETLKEDIVKMEAKLPLEDNEDE